MACAPHYCSYHSTGTTTCSGHRAACGTNRVISWGDAVQGGPVYASQVEEIRVAIRNELATWNAHAWYEKALLEPAATTTGQPVIASTFNNLDNMVQYLYGGSLYTTAAGGIVDDYNWDTLINRYNVVRQNCICVSDCSCNAICACYGDCGCYYSDERLKQEIEYC